MRILLLNPPADDRFIRESRCQERSRFFQLMLPPLTLAYMAALLRKKNDVEIIDCMGDDIGAKEIFARITNSKPSMIFVNTTTPTIIEDMNLIRKIKKISDAKICIFGVHATYLAKKILSEEMVDIVIKGEPEITARELSEKSIKDVAGVVYKDDDGKVIENADRKFVDIEEFPFPAWDMLNLENYRNPFTKKKFLMIATGRGCPFECSFCVSPFYYGRKVRKRKIESIIKEIKYCKNLGVNDFLFFEETFTIDKKFVMKLCDNIIKSGLDIKWMCNSRVDTVDNEMLEKMKEAGCWLISFGIESGEQKILDRCKKGTTIEMSRKAVETTKKSGIATLGHFILGLPGESRGSIRKTIDFSKRLELDFAQFYLCVPFPGTRLFEELKIKYDTDWSRFEYSFNTVSKLDLEHEQRKAYREFYLRRKAIKNIVRILGLRNLHRIFTNGIKLIV